MKPFPFQIWPHLGRFMLLIFAIAMASNALGIEPVANALKFELDIEPILTARGCNSGPCHGKARGQNGFALSLLGFDPGMDYDSIIHNAKGRRVAFSNPSQSILLLKAIGAAPHGGGVRIHQDDEDYRLILQWIQQGAPRVNDNDRKLTSVEILPKPHPMKAGQEESLQVIAKYSDGSQRIVTNTCAYQSNEPAVISVNQHGKLKAGQLPGEATIMARYMGMIATWSSAVPREEVVLKKSTHDYRGRISLMIMFIESSHRFISSKPTL